MTTIEPMKYHGPGWTLDLSERDEYGEIVTTGEHYQIWAPQSEADIPEGAMVNGAPRRPRDHWAACWTSGDGEAGDFIKSKTFAEVVSIFPDRVARRFRANPDITRCAR